MRWARKVERACSGGSALADQEPAAVFVPPPEEDEDDEEDDEDDPPEEDDPDDEVVLGVEDEDVDGVEVVSAFFVESAGFSALTLPERESLR
ncbi:MAG TPA: hypothetical protein VN408_13105 [Actinoplanes sp.]|nr:hypothetical protein [Actinoplanes sp.]